MKTKKQIEDDFKQGKNPVDDAIIYEEQVLVVSVVMGMTNTPGQIARHFAMMWNLGWKPELMDGALFEIDLTRGDKVASKAYGALIKKSKYGKDKVSKVTK